jgi:hypothetical protein
MLSPDFSKQLAAFAVAGGPTLHTFPYPDKAVRDYSSRLIIRKCSLPSAGFINLDCFKERSLGIFRIASSGGKAPQGCFRVVA